MKKALVTGLLSSLFLTLMLSACKKDDETRPTVDFPRNGLIGFYPFNGNANDEAENPANGTVNGAVLTTDRHGTANKAYQFDGVDDFISCGTPAKYNLTGDLTIAAWFKQEDLSESGVIVDKYNDSSNGFSFGASATRLVGNVEGEPAFITKNFAANSWVFVAMTYNKAASTVKLYQAGNKVAENTTATTLTSADVNFLIGRREVAGLFMQGAIDDVMIYSRTLSDEEINLIYQQTITN